MKSTAVSANRIRICLKVFIDIKTFKQILRFPMKKEGDPKGFIPLRESDLCKQSPSGVRTKRGWLMLLSQPLVFGGEPTELCSLFSFLFGDNCVRRRIVGQSFTEVNSFSPRLPSLFSPKINFKICRYFRECVRRRIVGRSFTGVNSLPCYSPKSFNELPVLKSGLQRYETFFILQILFHIFRSCY